MICSNKELLHKELGYLRLVFLKKNKYALWRVKQLMKEIEESQNKKEVTKASIMEHPNPQDQKFHSLLLPSTGSEGTAIV